MLNKEEHLLHVVKMYPYSPSHLAQLLLTSLTQWQEKGGGSTMHTKGSNRGTYVRKTQYSRVHLPHLGTRHWMKGVIPRKILGGKKNPSLL